MVRAVSPISEGDETGAKATVAESTLAQQNETIAHGGGEGPADIAGLNAVTVSREGRSAGELGWINFTFLNSL